MNPKVDFYFSKARRWQDEIEKLRMIVLDCELTEELKWGCPAYNLEGSKIVLIHVFKEYCALLFFKGVLMKDPKSILIQQTENVQTARQMRFTSIEQIVKMQATIKAYIKEAIAVEKAGLKVPLKKTAEFKMSEEFKNVLEDMPKLKTAFYALTPGRQKGYLLHFSSAKQQKTRQSRIEKYIPQILKRKGLED
ncbi:MAG: YdeI/OmpD-associated family protein [Bacteroidota bacterium]|nr:YdeI/OmpD-associated family protein [Bacteroidota bacterium]